MSIFDFYNDLKLKAPVGNNLQNNDDDVRTVRVGLEALGHFGQSERERDVYGKPLGMITAQMDEKIRAFQRQENLKEDGRANPGGETITTMSKRLKEKQLAVEPPPAYRKEVFKGTRLQEWETFNRKLENNPKFTPNERQIIRDIYAAEGGMKKAPNSTAYAGILQTTLDRFAREGYLEAIQKKYAKSLKEGETLKNTDFDMDDVIEFYDRYFDDAMKSAKLGHERKNPGKTIRGLELLGKLDNKVGHAVADTFFKNGGDVAVKIIQGSLNEYLPPRERFKTDESIGSGNYKMLQDIASDKEKSRAFLKILAKNRSKGEDDSSKEKARIEYYITP